MDALQARHSAALAIGLLVIGSAAFCSQSGEGSARPTSTAVGDTSLAAPAKGQVVGSAGCAAASCHGASASRGVEGAEHTTFNNYDPHKNAYAVLFQERSRRMVRLLAEGDGEPVVPAHRNSLCLNCHGANPINIVSPLSSDSVAHRDAACENCHGAAEKWLTAHYSPGWKLIDEQTKAEQYGLLPTKDLAYRAKVCAGCHIGEPGREVNHRLIAAGHPALRFEFATYQAEPVYTKHWREKGYGQDLEAWAWLIGQVASGQASAELLAERAEAAKDGDAGRDWPELAEYSCFSCHQDLTPGSVTIKSPRRRGPNDPKPGVSPWGSWYFPLLRDSAKILPAEFCTSEAEGGCELSALAQLNRLFQNTDRPDASEVATAARSTAEELDKVLRKLQASARRSGETGEPIAEDALDSLLGNLLGYGQAVSDTGPGSTDWDRHTQAYLGTVAMYRTRLQLDPTLRNREAEELFGRMRQLLRFPKGQDAPSRDVDRDEVEIQELWKSIHHRLLP